MPAELGQSLFSIGDMSGDIFKVWDVKRLEGRDGKAVLIETTERRRENVSKFSDTLLACNIDRWAFRSDTHATIWLAPLDDCAGMRARGESYRDSS